jgi:uncharacterized protein (DUF433 family)
MSVALLLTRNEAAQLSGASSATVNKAIEQRVVATRSVHRTSLIDARDVGALRLFAGLRFRLPVQDKRRLCRWLRTADPDAEMNLGQSALVVRKTREIDRTIMAALRYAELKDRFFELDPERQGGEPVIRGTRIPIRGLARQIEAGESREVLREQYDYIDEGAFEFAVQWAKAHPRRGRPIKHGTSASSHEPMSRRAHIERRRRAQVTGS